jgi:osmotically-inducible protein OsmY
MSYENAVVAEICDELERNPLIAHPVEVAVSERHGTVTLRGTVRSLEQRRRRSTSPSPCAASTSSRTSYESTRVIIGRTTSCVAPPCRRWSSADVPDERIEATVSSGWLTLKGDVKHQYESNAAYEAVRGLPGLVRITNKITVITAGVDG